MRPRLADKVVDILSSRPQKERNEAERALLDLLHKSPAYAGLLEHFREAADSAIAQRPTALASGNAMYLSYIDGVVEANEGALRWLQKDPQRG